MLSPAPSFGGWAWSGECPRCHTRQIFLHEVRVLCLQVYADTLLLGDLRLGEGLGPLDGEWDSVLSRA